MTAALPFLKPVIDQSIQRVPLDAWSVAFFTLVAVGSAYVALRRSPWIVALLAFGTPFAVYRDVVQTTITVEKCIVLGAVAGLLLGGAPLLPRSRSARWIFLAGAGVAITIALSSTNATYEWYVVRELLKHVEYLALFWCAATAVERIPRSIPFFVGGVTGSAAIVSTLAVAQAVFGGAPSGVWVNGHPVPRVASTLEGPNQLAGYLEAVLPVLWVWPMLTSGWKPLRNYVTGAAAAGLVLTQSRAGVLVAALSYGILARMRLSTARASLAAVIVGAVFGVIVSAAWLFGWAHASFADVLRLFYFAVPGEPGGVGARSQLWPAAIELFRRHPVFGVGAGNYELLLPTVGLHGIQTHASSLWLQTLAEQGLFGIAALIAFAWVALRETYSLARRSPLALAAFLALASLLVHQVADDLFFFPKVAALCWLLLGIGSAHELATLTEPRPNGKAQNLLVAPSAHSQAPGGVGPST